jgi:hypothetical protein
LRRPKLSTKGSLAPGRRRRRRRKRRKKKKKKKKNVLSKLLNLSISKQLM